MTALQRYRPDIDGIRAIAVISVVLFHVGGLPVTGGFVGVDVFFVISGYLIASSIFEQTAAGRFSLVGFYERRFRRLQPALIAVMLATVLACSVVLTPIDYKAFGQSAGSALLFCSNVLFYLKAGYFDPTSETKPLLHTWSLGVEEQYYLVFPLLVMAMRHWRRAGVNGVLAGLALLSLAWSAYGAADHPEAVFYLPFSRMWELLLGVLLVRCRDLLPRGDAARECMALAGLGLVVGSVLAYQPGPGYPSWLALLPCLGCVLLIAAGEGGLGRVSRVLAWRPMAVVGAISYSMYLWHWPILVLLKYVLLRELRGGEIVAYLAALLAISWLSWRWVESPVRRGVAGGFWTRRAVFAMAGLSMLSVGLFAVYAHASNGAPGRWSAESQRLAAAALDINPLRAPCDGRTPEDVAAGRICVIGANDARPATFAVLGDSFGDALLPGFEVAAKAAGLRGVVLTHSGCFPLVGIHQRDARCHEFSTAFEAYLRSHPEIVHVFVVSRWTSALLGNRFGQFKQEGIFITDGQSTVQSSVENRRVFASALRRTVDALGERRVSLVAFIPEQRYDIPRALSLSNQLHLNKAIDLPIAEHEERQRALRQAFAQAGLPGPRVEVIDVGAMLCDARVCKVQAQGAVLYADDNHLSRAGAVAVSPLLVRAMKGP